MHVARIHCGTFPCSVVIEVEGSLTTACGESALTETGEETMKGLLLHNGIMSYGKTFVA